MVQFYSAPVAHLVAAIDKSTLLLCQAPTESGFGLFEAPDSTPVCYFDLDEPGYCLLGQEVGAVGMAYFLSLTQEASRIFMSLPAGIGKEPVITIWLCRR